MSKPTENVAQKVLSGLGANALGKLWILLAQLVTVPVLTAAWGAKDYGIWLMLSTVPSYVALSSFGFGAAAATDMTHAIARGDHAAARSAFQSVWLFLSGILGIVFILASGLLALDEKVALLPGALRSHGLPEAAFLLVIYSVAAVQMSIVNGGFQSTRRYALGTALFDLSVPLETGALVAAALVGGGLLGAAAAMTAARVVLALGYYLTFLRLTPHLGLGFRHASMANIKRLARPAIGSMWMNMASAVSLQGMLTAVGAFISPQAAAIFGTARLLTRTPLQLVGMFGRAALPEMTRAYGQGRQGVATRLLILNLLGTTALMFPAALIFAIGGDYLLSLMSHHRLVAPPGLLPVLAITATAQAIWTAISQGLFALNKQHLLSRPYLILSIIAALSPAVTVRVGAGLTGATAVWCACETAMLFWAWATWIREARIKPGALRLGVEEIFGSLLSIARRFTSLAIKAR